MRLAAENNSHTQAYRQAQRAQEAVRQHSVGKAKAAREELLALEPQILAAKRLVTPEALRCLDSATQFFAAGGAEALAALQAAIEDLLANLHGIDDQLTAIAPLLTQNALVAHAGACKFAQGGGRARLQELSSQEEALRQELAELQRQLPLLDTQLSQLRERADAAAQREREFMATYPTVLDRLTRARAFEAGGSAAFMEARETTRAELEAHRDALNPLQSINYKRAQAFKDHQGHDEITLQRMIGDARSRRDQAEARSRKLTTRVEGLDGDLAWAQQAAETLHELAHFLLERRKALAPFEQDLKARELGASPAEAHASYANAEATRLRLLEWRPGQPFDLTLIAPLRDEVQSIDVSRAAKEVNDARRQVNRAQDRFVEVRNAFCIRATAAKDGGFTQPEIEAIREANTPAALAALADIGTRMRAQLEEELAALAELERSAATTENASIENLTRLVENCSANLTIMKSVMTRNPKAGFIVSADIRNLMVDLKVNIEGRKREVQARATLMRRPENDATLRADVRRALIERILINPSVQFHHLGMLAGDTRHVRATMSEGQKAALQMMWLIKESEYHLECTVRRFVGGGSRKKLRSRTQRVLFFDGLFSNLTERSLIDEAFKGLGDPDSSLQLIGLIHNPEYRNNFSIFPSYVVGRRAGRRDVDGERSFVRFQDGRDTGTLGLAAFMQRRAPAKPGAPAGG